MAIWVLIFDSFQLGLIWMGYTVIYFSVLHTGLKIIRKVLSKIAVHMLSFHLVTDDVDTL